MQRPYHFLCFTLMCFQTTKDCFTTYTHTALQPFSRLHCAATMIGCSESAGFIIVLKVSQFQIRLSYAAQLIFYIFSWYASLLFGQRGKAYCITLSSPSVHFNTHKSFLLDDKKAESWGLVLIRTVFWVFLQPENVLMKFRSKIKDVLTKKKKEYNW